MAAALDLAALRCCHRCAGTESAITIGLIIMAATLATAGPPTEPRCDGDTREIDACLQKRLKQTEAELARYVATARKSLAEETPDDGPGKYAKPAFEAAEKAFAQYRDKECAALGDYYGIGSGRAAAEIRCRIRVTRLHTHTVWAVWLGSDLQGEDQLPEPQIPLER